MSNNNSLNKFYTLYKRAITNNIFWDKRFRNILDEKTCRDALLETTPKTTIHKRDYFIFSDYTKIEYLFYRCIKEGRIQSSDEMHKLANSIIRHYIEGAAKQISKSTKIFISINSRQQICQQRSCSRHCIH